MSRKKPRVYDKEFKLNAINLYLSSGRPCDQISDEFCRLYDHAETEKDPEAFIEAVQEGVSIPVRRTYDHGGTTRRYI